MTVYHHHHHLHLIDESWTPPTRWWKSLDIWPKLWLKFSIP
jgi:hypothetical protein